MEALKKILHSKYPISFSKHQRVGSELMINKENCVVGNKNLLVGIKHSVNGPRKASVIFRNSSLRNSISLKEKIRSDIPPVLPKRNSKQSFSARNLNTENPLQKPTKLTSSSTDRITKKEAINPPTIPPSKNTIRYKNTLPLAPIPNIQSKTKFLDRLHTLETHLETYYTSLTIHNSVKSS